MSAHSPESDRRPFSVGRNENVGDAISKFIGQAPEFGHAVSDDIIRSRDRARPSGLRFEHREFDAEAARYRGIGATS